MHILTGKFYQNESASGADVSVLPRLVNTLLSLKIKLRSSVSDARMAMRTMNWGPSSTIFMFYRPKNGEASGPC